MPWTRTTRASIKVCSLYAEKILRFGSESSNLETFLLSRACYYFLHPTVLDAIINLYCCTRSEFTLEALHESWIES